MKKKYPGYASHLEYHTINPKKEKAGNCIYLTTERICTNSESLRYLEKCFSTSYCGLRIKEGTMSHSKESEPLYSKKATPKKEKVRCSLDSKCGFFHKIHGNGIFESYNSDKSLITIKFPTITASFKYPDAILNGFLKVSDENYRKVLSDNIKKVNHALIK